MHINSPRSNCRPAEIVLVWIAELDPNLRYCRPEFLKAFHTRHTQLSGILKSGVNWASSWNPELKTKRYVSDEYYALVPVAQTMMNWHMCDMHIQPSIFTVSKLLQDSLCAFI